MVADKNRLDELKIDRQEEARNSPTKWPYLLAAVLALVGIVAVALWFMRGSVPRVRTEVVRQLQSGSQETVLNASGYVTARRQATVSSKVTGKVLEVLIEEGMTVRKDQVLARLDTSNVEANLKLAEAQLASSRSALRETEVRWQEAKLELRRVSNLVEQEISSQAELDVAQAEADSLAARLDRQRTEVAVAEQQVYLWQQEMEDRIIRAPFEGVVVAKNAQPGEMISPVSAGGGFTRTGIGTLVDMESLEIEVDVNEAYINRVQAGQDVVAILDAYPDWQIPCHVIAIIPTADRQKATVQVRVGFGDLDPRILPDMGVKVAFQDSGSVAEQARGVGVPQAALRRDGSQDVVLVVSSDTIERRAIQVGEERGQEVVVLGGLASGERVVVEGPESLAEGDRVEEMEP